MEALIWCYRWEDLFKGVDKKEKKNINVKFAYSISKKYITGTLILKKVQ